MKTLDFTAGFEPIALPFIRCPMMKPFRFRTEYVAATDTLVIHHEHKWLNNDEDPTIYAYDTFEFSPAKDGKVQEKFLKALTDKITHYNEQLAICCSRRYRGETMSEDIGFYRK